jgi:hypothetical protein
LLRFFSAQLHLRVLAGRFAPALAPTTRELAAAVLIEGFDGAPGSQASSGGGRSASFAPALASGGGEVASDAALIELSSKAVRAAQLATAGMLTPAGRATLLEARTALYRMRVALVGPTSLLGADAYASLARKLVVTPVRALHSTPREARRLQDAAGSQSPLPPIVPQPPMLFDHVVRLAYASSAFSPANLPAQGSADLSRAQEEAIALHCVDVVRLADATSAARPAPLPTTLCESAVRVAREEAGLPVQDEEEGSGAGAHDPFAGSYGRVLRALPPPPKGATGPLPPHVELLCRMEKVAEAAQLLCALGRWEDAFESIFCAPRRGVFTLPEIHSLSLSDVAADGLLQWRRLAALESRPGRWVGLVSAYSADEGGDASDAVRSSEDESIWITLFRSVLKSGDSERVRKLFERLPQSATIIGVLAVVNGALSAGLSNAARS